MTKDTFFLASTNLLETDQQNLELTETHKEDALPKFRLTLKHENKNIKDLASLLPDCYDESNEHFSIQCQNCINLLKKHNWAGTVDTDTVNFSKCYGGDLMWLSSV